MRVERVERVGKGWKGWGKGGKGGERCSGRVSVHCPTLSMSIVEVCSVKVG